MQGRPDFAKRHERFQAVEDPSRVGMGMARSKASKRRLHLTVAATAAAGLVAGVTATSTAAAAPATAKLAHGVKASKLTAAGLKGTKAKTLPAGLPKKGRYAFLLKLDTKSTSSVYATIKKSRGTASARSAARAQLSTVTTAQNRTIGALPESSKVIYRTHAALAGVAVVTDVKNYAALRQISGVSAVYPIAPKTPSNSYAVPLQGGAAAWDATGDHGENATVAVIDTGVDYTHANFGGPGTVDAYNTAKANDADPVDPASYDHAKFNASTLDVNGNPAYMYDFAGDSYNADPNDPAYQPVPAPDPNPLDCNSHGSHVAGTAAGYGENADGSTYTGTYDADTPFDQLRIGPGMAPKARLYAYKIFGCEGSTNVTGEAIDKAMDPNGDGDTSDHADVVNMSLGSDYTFPDDGDSILTNEASQIAGVTMVVASGNGGDIYDIGGSPGNAVRAIAVASSQDAYAQTDALHVTAPGNIAGDYASERSIAYDWQTEPDLIGDVVALSDPANQDGCLTFSDADKAAVDGKIVFEEWTDTDADRRCGSVARATKLAATNAIGFIFGDDEESFAAGITGSETIPGVLVSKSGADAIRTELQAGHTVTVNGTTLAGFRQIISGLDDTVSSFSSRGIRDEGNVKPDVTAVGSTVFSTGMGTGNEGLNDSGTSMATPMVAGTAALVVSQHPDWTPEQVKADIMNTADADLYRDPDFSGAKYAPNRVGAGRIDVNAALSNSVLAYTTDGPGGTSTGNVSASFGPIPLTAADGVTVKTKTIKVQNTGLDPVSYDVGFDDRTTIPGATYTVSPSSVTVDPQSSTTVTLTLTIDPSELTKTIDPTVERETGGNPRQYVADASGLVMFTNDDPSVQSLRVPAYAAPRPASDMTQAASLTMPSGSMQSALLPLTGQPVDQGSGAETVQSIVAGFELQATSGPAPQCSATVTENCWDIPSQRAADLKYVGTTSDAPQLRANGENPLTAGSAYFALSTQHSFRNPVGALQYLVWIDSNGDNQPDSVLLTARIPASTSDTDVMVSELIDLNTFDVLDAEPINAALGDTDTAVFDSDTFVLPVAIGAIPGVDATHSRIKYVVEAYDGYHSSPVDSVGGFNITGTTFTSSLSMDVLNPGLSVAGSYTGHSSPLLFQDSPGSVLAIRRNAASYAADHGQGALMVHFHNEVGAKAQVVTLKKQAASVKLAMAPNPVAQNSATTATITVSGSSGTPTGSVTLRRTDGRRPTNIASATLVNGKATLKYTPKSRGRYHYQAIYSGDANYNAATSATVSLVVEPRPRPRVRLSMSPNPVVHRHTVTVTITVSGAVGTPTGTVTLRRTDGRTPANVASGPLVHGRATLKYTPKSKGTYHYQARYAGSSSYSAGYSPTVALRIT